MNLKPSERIEILISKLEISQKKFADKLDINQATLSKMFKSKTNPGFPTLIGICTAFPGVNLEWIVCGRGEMFKPVETEAIEVKSDYVKRELQELKNKFEALEKMIDGK